MKKGLGLQANISDFNTTLPQTKHLNFFMGTNPVGYANGGAVRRGVPMSNMNVTQGFLPMALGFDNGGEADKTVMQSFYGFLRNNIKNYLRDLLGVEPSDQQVEDFTNSPQGQEVAEQYRLIFENEYGSGVSAGAYDSGFPIGGAQSKEPPMPTETATDKITTDIGEMRIPEGFPDEPNIIDKSKEVLGNVVDFGTDLTGNVVQEFFPPPTKEEIGAGLDTLLKENEAKNLPKVEEKVTSPQADETTVNVESATVTDKPVDSGISSLAADMEAGGKKQFSKKEQEELQETLKAGTGNKGKKDVPSWALPLMSAGFAMMASKSPYFLQALGEAGQEGIKTLTAQKQAEQDRLDAQADRDLAAAQAAYYRGEGRQTTGKTIVQDGVVGQIKNGQFVPVIDSRTGKALKQTLSEADAIEILQKSNPAFVNLDATEQRRQINALLNLYNNTNLVVNDNMKVDEDGGFDFLPFLKNVFGEFT
tara:strand:- start:5485 stop:6915 length:1431 start_codon:yes stop_codon:yes gene_type:complete